MKRTTTLTLFVFSATLFLAISQASAQMINSAITKDTTVYFHGNGVEIADHNFGGYDFDDGETHFALGLDNRPASTLDQQRPLLKAGNIVTDLANAGVSSSSQIASAELHLFQIFPHIAPDRTGEVHRLTTGGWVEGTGEFSFEDGTTTWNNVLHGGAGTPSVGGTPWTNAGGDFDPTSVGSFSMPEASSGHIEHSLTITDAVRYWFDNPSENFGVILIQDPLGDTPAYFAASEDSINNGSYVPYISIAIPEPSSMVLILVGLVGLASCGWRRCRMR